MSSNSNFESALRSVGMKRVTERHLYSGQGIDGLTAQLNALLKAEKQTQRVVIDINRDYIHLEKLVKGQNTDQDELQARYDAAIRNRPMTEYLPPTQERPLPGSMQARDKPPSSYEQVFDMFRLITDEGLQVFMVLCGSMQSLAKWVRISPKNPSVFGVPVMAMKMLPNDAIIVCGAEWKEADPEDIVCSVKGVI